MPAWFTSTGLVLPLQAIALAGSSASGLAAAPAALSATGPELEGAQKAVLMLILLAVVLGTFLVLVVAMALMRRARRRRQPPAQQPVAMPDPWTEAGRRIEPYDGDRQ